MITRINGRIYVYYEYMPIFVIRSNSVGSCSAISHCSWRKAHLRVFPLYRSNNSRFAKMKSVISLCMAQSPWQSHSKDISCTVWLCRLCINDSQISLIADVFDNMKIMMMMIINIIIIIIQLICPSVI